MQLNHYQDSQTFIKRALARWY